MTQLDFKFNAMPSWILLVEDDEANSRLFEMVIGRMGFDVKSAQTAGEALGLLGRELHKPRLILMDWRLPDSTGDDLLAAFHKAAGEVPIAVLTGDVRVKPRNVSSVLYKPFSLDELARILPTSSPS